MTSVTSVGASLSRRGALPTSNLRSVLSKSPKRWTRFLRCETRMTNDERSPNNQFRICVRRNAAALDIGISIVIRYWALVISSLGFLFLTVTIHAADSDNSADIDALIRSADQWAKENLDEDALRVLRSVDQDRVKQVFGEL